MTNLRPALATLLQECQTRGLRFVGTRGDTSSPLCFIGEAPGADEDTAGVPFCGPSGRLLDSIIREAGFSTPHWFTNVYKVRPPDNELEKLATLGVPDAVYINEFFEELREHKPAIICVCGATPLGALCPQTIDSKSGTAKISHWRGSLLTSQHLNWPHYIFPIYHPAFLLREWQEKYFNTFLLQKLKQEFDFFTSNGRLQPLPTRELIVEPNFAEAYEYLSDIINNTNGTSYPVSVDIETLRRRYPYTNSFAKSGISAISIGYGDYGADNGSRLYRLMDKILSQRPVVGQNYINFDAHWQRAIGFNSSVELVHDTRIRHAVLWPELSHKLEVMTMQYTREPYYKEEGRSWNKVSGQGKKQLMRYNCKDTCVTREIFDVQELEFSDRPELRPVYERDIKLSRQLHHVSYRGKLVDASGMNVLRADIVTELSGTTTKLEQMIGSPVATSADEQKAKPGSVNIGSAQQLLKLLEKRGIKVPKQRGTGKQSTNEEALNNLFAETNDELLNEVLRVRELNKIKSTYVEARLVDNVLYGDFVVGGTETGRRSSKAFPLGFGVNDQNLPKHSKLGKRFRSCLVARPGKIFLSCDQMSAEDWIVQGIIADQSGDESGIIDLRSGIDRHCKLAMFVFALPEGDCNKAAEKSGKIFRYVGKRTRHGGHYDMRGNKMSGVLAKEGYSVPAKHCDYLLERFHQREPNIRGVFHEYVKKEITDKRSLTNLFGRQRYFLGFCPWRDNGEVFRAGYSYIPQGTVGDNTGCSITYCEDKFYGLVISESHDSNTLEIDDNADALNAGVKLLARSFHRTLRFPRGYELEIPIEFEIGYNMRDTYGLGDNLKDPTGCGSLTKKGLSEALEKYRETRNKSLVTC